ncbi:hypothetical protein [Halobacterium yunchengense]|uniref:hypothetical protein n=1 Tax=Halobacterium yunchengense TaxID=3108497 RepID=UPI00300B3407
MGDGDRWQTPSGDADDGRHDDEQVPNVDLETAGAAGSDGIGRRKLLAVGGLAAAGAGGWYVFLREDGQSSPAAVSKRNWQAWEDGDAAAYRATFHAESPARDASYWSDDQYWEDFGPDDGVEVAHVGNEVVEGGDDRAVVEEVYRRDAPDSEPEDVTSNVELRTEDGAWKVWTIEYVSSEPAAESG